MHWSEDVSQSIKMLKMDRIQAFPESQDSEQLKLNK